MKSRDQKTPVALNASASGDGVLIADLQDVHGPSASVGVGFIVLVHI